VEGAQLTSTNTQKVLAQMCIELGC